MMDPEKLIKNINGIRPWLAWTFVIIFFTGIAYYANFSHDTIYDPDSFYHIRHAWLYQQNGILYSDFPWVQYSVIKDLKADLWYGFHIVLLPFTYFNDLTFGIKLSGFFITLFVLWSFYFSFKNLGVLLPLFWSSFFIFSSPSILKRMAMTRPHPLSLGLFVLLFSLLIRGPWWPILILSFLVSWIHSSMFWLPFIIFTVVSIFKKINNQKIDFLKLAAMVAGLAGGLLARPNPIANLKLIYIQIVELYTSKAEVLDQIIGGELRPPTLSDVRDNFMFLGIILVLNVILLAVAFYKNRKNGGSLDQRIAILSSLVIILISILMYINANRAIDILAAFTIIFSGLVTSNYLSRISEIKLRVSNKILSLIIITALLFTSFVAYNSVSNLGLATAKLRTAFMEPSLWLKNNTKEGEIVFNIIWSQFPVLFFWNQNNYYINGMDPIFLYKYDQELYWKLFYIHAKDMGGLTCGSMVCGPDQIEPVYDVLVRDFKVSYIFTRKLSNQRFGEYLESDKKHFEKVYDEGLSTIYKVLYPKPTKTIKKTP